MFFEHLASLQLEPVYATTADGRQRAIKALDDAREIAGAARACETEGAIVDASHQWRRLFNWEFPAR